MVAKRDPGFLAGLALGFASGFRGVGMLAATPRWWGLALAPALVTAAAVVLAFTPLSAGGKEWLEQAIRIPPEGVFRTIYDWFFGAMVAVAAVLLLLFVYAPLVRTISAPFLALLADSAVARVSGAPTPAAPGSKIVRWVIRPLGEALLVLVIRLFWMAMTSPVLCVPVLGPFLWAAVLLPLEGFDLLDIALSARGKLIHGRMAFANSHRGATIGLGLARTILLLIPCLNIFLLPGTVVGAVLLDERLSDDFPRGGPSGCGPSAGPGGGREDGA